jgi:hypothetical protein
MFVDEFLPAFDFSDTIESAVAADATTTWDALVQADLIEVGRRRSLIGLLGAVRILPELVWRRLHGEHPPAAPQRLTLRDTTKLPMGLLWATMRTATTDEHARDGFRRYWTLGVGYGAHVLVHGLLDHVREHPERRAGSRPSPEDH